MFSYSKNKFIKKDKKNNCDVKNNCDGKEENSFVGNNFEIKEVSFFSNIKEIFILLLIVFIIRTFGFGLYQVPTGSMETTMLVGERFFADKFTLLFSDLKRGDIIAFNDPLYAYSNNSFVRLFQEYFWGPSNWTKRLIGLPGDQIEGIVENGKPRVYVNGKLLDEPYTNKYPLIYVWKIDFDEVQKKAKSSYDIGSLLTCRSYDPKISFEDQKFYRIDRERIFVGQDYRPIIINPETCIDKGKIVKNGQNYWNNGDDFCVKLGPDQYWVMGDNRLGSHDSRIFGPIEKRLVHGKILFRIWSVDSDADWWIFDFIKNPSDFIKRMRFDRFFQRVR